MKHTKICIVCGKEFTKPYYTGLPEWRTRKFCSKVCVNKGRTPWNKGKNTGLVPKTAFKKGRRPSRKTEFKKGSIPWNKGRNDYLTREDRKRMGDYWRGKTGKDSPNWRGGITKLGAYIRSLNKYKQWRMACFERDDWTCVHCGAKRKKGSRVVLNCDHIRPFYKILYDNKIKTVEQAKKCKELWDIDNGRTSCIPCHKQTPSYLVNQHTIN